MCYFIKKVNEHLDKVFDSEGDQVCCVFTYMWSIFLAIVFLLISYDWILAEITTPIRCAIAGDTTRILMPLDEWQKQRGIEKLAPIKTQEEYSSLFKSEYKLTPVEKKVISRTIKFNNRIYEFSEINLKSGIVFYQGEESYLDIFVTYYWLIYDMKLQKVILTSKDIIGRYSLIAGVGVNWVQCNGSGRFINKKNMRELSYQYNF